MDDPTTWASDEVEKLERHRQERADNGFSVYDWWNFDEYLRFVIVGGLKKFRDEGNGFPGELTETGWKNTLDAMIEGFEAIPAVEKWFEETENWTVEEYGEKYSEANAKQTRALELFSRYFNSLWD